MGFLKLLISTFITTILLTGTSADARFLGGCILLAGFIAYSDKN